MSQRKESYDLAKFVAITLVVLAHLGTYGIHDFAYSFHMPLFAIISGYFFSFTGNFFSFCLIKARQLLLPIIAWSLISAIFFIRLPHDLNMLLQQGEKIHIMAYLRDFWSQICSSAWFLKSLYYCFVYAFICFKFPIKSKNMILIGSIVLLYTCSFLGIIPNKPGLMLDGFFFLYPFFVCGIIYKSEEIRFSYRRLLLIMSIIVYFLCYCIFWNHEYCWYTTNTSIFEPSYIDNCVTPIEGTFLLYVVLLRFIVGLSGSIMVIVFLSIIMSEKKYRNNSVIIWLCKIGQYTLGIYLFQDCIMPLLRDSFVGLSECFQFGVSVVLSFLIILVAFF